MAHVVVMIENAVGRLLAQIEDFERGVGPPQLEAEYRTMEDIAWFDVDRATFDILEEEELERVPFRLAVYPTEIGADLVEVLQFPRLLQTYAFARNAAEGIRPGAGLGAEIHLLREVYYEYTDLYGDQSESDKWVRVVQATLLLPRASMRIYAGVRAQFIGHLAIEVRGSADGPPRQLEMTENAQLVPVNVTYRGAAFPPHAPIDHNIPMDVTYVRHLDAQFLLVVEKETIFNYFATSRGGQEPFWVRHRCILITSSGYPCAAVRQLLVALRGVYPELPFYVLVDGDPHGIDIFTTYLVGSKRLALDCPHYIRGLTYLGLRARDVPALRQNERLKARDVSQLTQNETDKINSMRAKPFLSDEAAARWAASDDPLHRDALEQARVIRSELDAIVAAGSTVQLDALARKNDEGGDTALEQYVLNRIAAVPLR